MRYRTVIELICEAASREDAYTTAGEFLKGDVDFGVEMKCTTAPLIAHKMYKAGAMCVAVLIVFSLLLVNADSFNRVAASSGTVVQAYSSTCTIQPELKTKDKTEFRKDWEKKQEEAVLDYLKK